MAKQTLKHTFLTWLYQAPSFSSLSLNALNGLFFLLEKSPFLRDRIPLTSPRKNSITYLPASKAIKTPAADTHPADTIAINKRIEAAGNQVLPHKVLGAFIDQARVHFLMDQCICRSAFKCRNFTSDIGCLFMGDTALKLPPGLGRRVTREAAHQHARRANRAGLVPLTGKVNVDNLGFLIPDTGKLLSVCFCCHCCCMMGYYKHSPEHLKKIIKPIEGLLVEISDKCAGCGTCIETCRFDAIQLENGRAIHLDHCVGCGRCQTSCPNQAVTVTLGNPNYVKDVVARVGAYVNLE